MYTLNSLKLKQSGIVSNINCDANLKRRLSDLGIIKNTSITPVFKSVLGDPVAYEVRGSIIAIRNKDAKNIQIEI